MVLLTFEMRCSVRLWTEW